MNAGKWRIFNKFSRFKPLRVCLGVKTPGSSHLSQNLARLEKELGVPLFDRVGRNIKLNYYGMLFYEHVSKALLELEVARNSVEKAKGEPGDPTVFADALFNDTFSIVRQYLDENPSAKVIHLLLTIPEILQKLETRELDFGIIVSPKGFNFGPSFGWIPMWETVLLALMSADDPLASNSSIKLGKLKDSDFVGAIDGFDTRDAFDHYCKLAGFTPNYRYTTIKPYIFNEQTRKYGSVSIMSKIMYDCHEIPRCSVNDLRSSMDGVKAIPIIEPECVVEFGIITYKSKYLKKTTMDLIRFVQAYFEKNQGLF